LCNLPIDKKTGRDMRLRPAQNEATQMFTHLDQQLFRPLCEWESVSRTFDRNRTCMWYQELESTDFLQSVGQWVSAVRSNRN
jgi:hypothetical protein